MTKTPSIEVVCGGCAAKISSDVLHAALHKIPKLFDPNLIVGFESSDDAAVFKINEQLALVQTLDFFPPMVGDPYMFGKIAAANALSDVYAMGGEVKLALNIVCFPKNADPAILSEILRGGAEKVIEAGGVLCGGHSINDQEIKYGLSVAGFVDPARVLKNDAAQQGDVLLLTKPLGTGIIMAAHQMGDAQEESSAAALLSMQELNKTSAECAKKYNINACTDITGFGFIGHLCEMTGERLSAHVYCESIPILPGAIELAQEFYITAGGQKNRNAFGGAESIACRSEISPALLEVLFDPQTSGGLLIALPAADAKLLQADLLGCGIVAPIVGQMQQRDAAAVYLEMRD